MVFKYTITHVKMKVVSGEVEWIPYWLYSVIKRIERN